MAGAWCEAASFSLLSVFPVTHFLLQKGAHDYIVNNEASLHCLKTKPNHQKSQLGTRLKMYQSPKLINSSSCGFLRLLVG